MKTRFLPLALLFVLLLSPMAVPRDLFYFLTGATLDRENDIKTYTMDGVHQETFPLPPLVTTGRTAMTTDGSTAWFVYDP